MAFVLLDKNTGKPLHVHLESNDGQDDCGSFTCKLSTYDDDPLYTVDNIESIFKTLCFDVGWYNSDPKNPMREQFNLDNVEIAEMEVKYHKVDYTAPIVINDTLDTYDIPYPMAKRLSGMDLPQGDYVIVLIAKDTKLKFEQLKSMIGKLVYFGSSYNGRRVHGVSVAREEYADKAAFEMVCSLTE